MTGAALGCSHTAGTGINPSDCYVSVLSRMIGHTFFYYSAMAQSY